MCYREAMIPAMTDNSESNECVRVTSLWNDDPKSVLKFTNRKIDFSEQSLFTTAVKQW